MATTERDYYAVLGVPRTATPDDIKKAFRRLARQYHPDLHGGSKKAEMEKKFKELNEAHETLSDPDKRKKYDRFGHRWQEAEAYEKAREQAGAGQGGGSGFHWRQESAPGEGQDFGDFFENFFGRGGTRTRAGVSNCRNRCRAQRVAGQADSGESSVRPVVGPARGQRFARSM